MNHSDPRSVVHFAGMFHKRVSGLLGPTTEAVYEAGLHQVVILADDLRYRDTCSKLHPSVEVVRVPIAHRSFTRAWRTLANVLSEAVLERLEGALEKMEPEAEDRREALRECIKRVEGRRRNVLDLRYRENVRVNDIADRFGMSSSAVSVMLHRIRTDLLDCVRRRLKIQGTLP